MASMPTPPPAAQDANARGMAALHSGDFAGAAAAFAEAARHDPHAIPLWLNLAHAHRLAGDAEGERGALESALAVDATHFSSRLRLAQLHQRVGEDMAALREWNAVRQIVAQMPPLAGPVADEVAAGEAWCAGVQAQVEARIAGGLAKEAPAWDETEQRRIGAFVDVALGRRQVFRNECAGVHYPFLPADEFFDRRHFPWLDELEAAAPAIKAELAALLAGGTDQIRPYVRMEPGAPRNKWSALDHSLDWSACFLWEYGRPNEPVLARCPETARVLAGLPLARIEGRAPNAFFSMLRPHAHIPAHTGVTNTRAIIHLALDIPPGCEFRVGGETRPWVEGKAFAFDDTIDHEAWNPSDRRRAVLILDTWNPHLSERECAAIATYFAEADLAVGAGPLGGH